MNIAYLCVLVAGVLPVVCAGVAKWGFHGFDNHNPRDWLSRQTGFRARANAAQSNSFEAFPFFAIGVVLATLVHADSQRVDMYALVFVLSRLAFIGAYLANRASLRSFFWVLGFISAVGLYAAALGF
jgi:uncharacterized MAPEG superfamily protein